MSRRKYYYTCDTCGSNLDPGETCDICKENGDLPSQFVYPESRDKDNHKKCNTDKHYDVTDNEHDS